MKLPPEVSLLIQMFDIVVCAVFLIDFSLQFSRAENKAVYLRTGWIDLLASIPAIDVLRWGRVVRIFQIIRVLRAIRATHKVIVLLKTKQNIAGSVGLTAGMLVILSSLGIVIAENVPNSNIKTAGDALWWSCTTITTVGYGDRYPITAEGRLIAVVLMMAGVGLFGSFTALVAGYFTGSATQDPPEPSSKSELQALQQQVASLETLLLAMQKDAARSSALQGQGSMLSKPESAP